MNPKLQRIQNTLRQIKLLKYADDFRFLYKKVQNRKSASNFKKVYTDFSLPPDHLVFDANGRIDWWSYKESGYEEAKKIISLLEGVSIFKNGRFLEWGCGPGRVIRNMPSLVNNIDIYGSDYNKESIDWCQKNIPEVTFVINNLNPPLPFEDNYFDFIYAISVFTHLSDNVCLEWSNELSRVLKPGGLFMVWTNGDEIAKRILPEEREKYNEGNFVVRDKFTEGKKMYLSFHPPIWVENYLLKDYEILKHFPGGFSGVSQDIWLARLKNNKQ